MPNINDKKTASCFVDLSVELFKHESDELTTFLFNNTVGYMAK